MGLSANQNAGITSDRRKQAPGTIFQPTNLKPSTPTCQNQTLNTYTAMQTKQFVAWKPKNLSLETAVTLETLQAASSTARTARVVRPTGGACIHTPTLQIDKKMYVWTQQNTVICDSGHILELCLGRVTLIALDVVLNKDVERL
jgi:hypothetical protein